MRVKKITKRMVPGMLIVAVLGFGQRVEVIVSSTPDRVPASLAALYENSRLHFELHRKHYDNALEAMVLAKDIDLVEETTGMTALGLAAQDQSADAIDVVKPLVLKYGANLKLPDEKGFMPLHYAARAGNLAVVEFLENHGADVEAVNPLREKQGITPLYMARLYGRPRIVEFLRMRGADDPDPEILADVELTESMASASMELIRKRLEEARRGRRNRNVQEDARRQVLAITEAAARSLRKHGNYADLEAVQQYRDRYIAAVNSTQPEPGMSASEYRKMVDKVMAFQSPDGAAAKPCRTCPQR